MDYVKEKLNIAEKYKNPFKDDLENDEQYKKRWFSIYIIYFTMFLMSLGFSIVLTGVWPYLDKLDPTAGKSFMGYVVGANPFGQMLFSPLVGFWCNKLGSIRIPLIATLSVFILSSSIYSSLELFDTHRKYWMLGSRFLVGVSSANTAACRSYISGATRLSERRKAISMLSLAQVIGFIVGPALQAMVVPLGNDGFWFIENLLKLNMYTAAGWINVILTIINVFLFMPSVFHEYKIAGKEAMMLHGTKSEKETWKSVKIDSFSAGTLIVLHFVLVFSFMIMETLGTSVAMDEFGWTKAKAISFMGILMSVGALLTCSCFVFINILCKKYSEVSTMIWAGFGMMTVGRLFYMPWGSEPPLTIDDNYKLEVIKMIELCKFGNSTGLNCTLTEPVGCPLSQPWCAVDNQILVFQFVVGSIFGTLGFPVALTLLQTLFSKLLGSRPQGTWQGVMTGSGSLSRVIGPILMMHIYTHYGPTWTFGLTALMLMGSFVWLNLIAERLVIKPIKTIEPITTKAELETLSKSDV